MEKLIGISMLVFIISLVILLFSDEINDYVDFIKSVGMSIIVMILFFIAGLGIMLVV